jgi:hypothetical protein
MLYPCLARSSTSLALTLLLASLAWTRPIDAAPIHGRFTAHLAATPACSFSGGLAGLLNNNGLCAKVDDLRVMLESDLSLMLTLEGLDVASETVLTFQGLESQKFTISGILGAVSFTDILVFAPNVIEIEFVRSPGTLSIRYCINLATPGDITPPFQDCPIPDDFLFFLLENEGTFHPAVAHLVYSDIVDQAGMLDDPLTLRKQTIEMSVTLAGLTSSLRWLLANMSSVQTQNWQAGLILALEGQTVSGTTVRAETWVGARQGLECWGMCSAAERGYGGTIVPGFVAQEEKIFVRNLNLFGITHHFRVEFKFGQSNPLDNGLSYVEWHQISRLTPFGVGLTLNNTLRFDGNLNPRFGSLMMRLNHGDMLATTILYFYPNVGGDWEAQLAELIVMYDPPGAIVTSDLVLCTESFYAISCAEGVLQHHLLISAAVGSLTVDLRFIFFGLVSNFSELWADVSWRVGSVTLKTSLVLGLDFVGAFSFEIGMAF